MDLLLIFGGLAFVIAMMIFVINPPEAWIKRVFHKTAASKRPALKSPGKEDL